LIPSVRNVYREQVSDRARSGHENEISRAGCKKARLRAEAAKFGGPLIINKISDKTFEQLRAEWKGKLRFAQENLRNLEFDISRYLDSPESAIDNRLDFEAMPRWQVEPGQTPISEKLPPLEPGFYLYQDVVLGVVDSALVLMAAGEAGETKSSDDSG